VIGYSLPESDGFFRYLFALGAAGDAVLERLWVFNPDTEEGTLARFKRILGPGSVQRFSYFPNTFEERLDDDLTQCIDEGAIGIVRKAFQP